MASIAIDSTEIRAQHAAEPNAVRRSRMPLVASAAAAMGVLVAGAWAFYEYLPSIPRLAGLSSLIEPPRPARTDIRVGAFPAMPEIRDGVPALVEPRPVRVVGTSPAPLPRPEPASSAVPAASVAASPVAAVRPATVPAARGSSVLSPTLSAPAAMASVEPMRRMDAAPLAPVASPARAAEPAKPAPGPAFAPIETVDLRTDPGVVVAAPIRPAPTAAAEPAPSRNEPAETAALSPPAALVAPVPAALAVPLPPPAPPRLARAPESERPAIPARTAARPRPAAPPVESASAVVAPASAPVDAPADDRVEVLGMRLPNGRDIGNALSAIGDSVKNLPQRF